VCNYCGGKGIIKSGGKTTTITFCPHCIDAKKLLSAIKAAIQEARKSKNRDAVASLVAVQKFLPKYPVMAVMEAEARELHDDFIQVIMRAFGVLPFQ
jgi:glutaredoxin